MVNTEKLIIVQKEKELEELRHKNKIEELEKEIIIKRQSLELEAFRIKNAEHKRRDMANFEREKDLAEHKHDLFMKSKK